MFFTQEDFTAEKKMKEQENTHTALPFGGIKHIYGGLLCFYTSMQLYKKIGSGPNPTKHLHCPSGRHVSAVKHFVEARGREAIVGW